jgi:wyosine [tRNA(Phe)-imidazoG37] synthetase (radical SAM superfamily)
MKYVYGPVPSRRLGQSLGIDPIPQKTCNWNCVYCQLGRSRPLVNERKSFIPSDDILRQVEESLAGHKSGKIDWITFVGSGETTLHSELGLLIREVKALTNLPIAVITNGSLFYLPEVRQELLSADAVLPSLDAGNETLYRKINRPHPDLPFDRILHGMIAFRKEYKYNLWIEVMLIQGLNDTEEALTELAERLKEIQPDEVHILQPTRPPVEPWVKPSDEEGMLRARAILGKIAKVIHPINGTFDLNQNGNLVDAIVNIIIRHPMREIEIIEALENIPDINVMETLNELKKSGQAKVINRYGVKFWSASPSYYPAENGKEDESTT